MGWAAVTQPNALNSWRKMPRQARAEATVEAIFEASVQLLLSNGADALTTTRVAARAGVSVGTMYQYFPNKRALLLALFDRHIRTVADAVERGCTESRSQPLSDVATNLVSAFLSTIEARPQESRAAYGLLAEPENAELVKLLFERTTAAVAEALSMSTDASFDDASEVAMAVTNALAGSARSLIEHGLAADMVNAQRRQLTLMVSGYLQAAASRSQPSRGAIGTR